MVQLNVSNNVLIITKINKRNVQISLRAIITTISWMEKNRFYLQIY